MSAGKVNSRTLAIRSDPVWRRQKAMVIKAVEIDSKEAYEVLGASRGIRLQPKRNGIGYEAQSPFHPASSNKQLWVAPGENIGGFAAGKFKGNVFEFVRLLLRLDTVEEAVPAAYRLLYPQAAGPAGSLTRDEALVLWAQAKRRHKENQRQLAERFGRIMPLPDRVVLRYGVTKDEQGYLVSYTHKYETIYLQKKLFAGGRNREEKTVCLYDNRRLVERETKGGKKTVSVARSATYPDLRMVAATNTKIIVLTDHPESADILRQRDINAFAIPDFWHYPKPHELKALGDRTIVIFTRPNYVGAKTRRWVYSRYKSAGLDVHACTWPDEAIIPPWVTLCDVVLRDGDVELDPYRCTLDIKVPDELVQIGLSLDSEREKSAITQFNCVPALIEKAPDAVIPRNVKEIYRQFLLGQGPQESARLSYEVIERRTGMCKKVQIPAKAKCVKLGLLTKAGHKRGWYKALKHAEFMTKPLARQLYEANREALVECGRAKLGLAKV